jgi:hypothetical protein
VNLATGEFFTSYLCTYDFYGPYVMCLMRGDPLRRQVGEGWTLEIETFLGSVKWHRAVRRVPFGAQKIHSEKYFGQLPDNQYVKDFIKFRYFKMSFIEFSYV